MTTEIFLQINQRPELMLSVILNLNFHKSLLQNCQSKIKIPLQVNTQ